MCNYYVSGKRKPIIELHLIFPTGSFLLKKLILQELVTLLMDSALIDATVCREKHE